MRVCGIGMYLLSAALAGLAWNTCAGAEPDKARSYPAVTRPSEERTLSFSYPGVVREVSVKEGETVKSGQKLMKLDDRMDQKALSAAEIEAKSLLKIQYAQQESDQKKVQLERTQQLYDDNRAASPFELESAKLEYELAKTRLALSQEETDAKKLEADKQRIKVELAGLVSTIDGVVQRIGVKEGEFADPNQGQARPACVVVRNNPLRVEVYLPTALTSELKAGQELEVAYPGQKTGQKAKITFFDPVADAGSEMRKLWLELPNPENQESGRQVEVRVLGK